MSDFRTIKIPEISDHRGDLYVIDRCLPFEIKRVFFIQNATQPRGGHRHHKTRQAMICTRGSVDVYMNNGRSEETIHLNHPTQCLMIEPEDWHLMKNFSSDATLLVFASEHFSKEDYISEPYQ